jgi:hypothetical protein
MAQTDSTESQLKESYLAQLKVDSEREIWDESSDLTTRLYAIHHLNSALRQNPDLVDPNTVFVLRDILKDHRLAVKRQSLLFFRIAAETLCSILVQCKDKDRYLTELAFSALKDVMATTTGYGHRATTEAFTCLPLYIRGPDIRPFVIRKIPKITWDQLIDESGYKVSAQPAVYGRSIVIGINNESPVPEQLLVVKLVPAGGDPADLLAEACWMQHFSFARYSFPLRFNIPEIVKIKGADLFRLTRLPRQLQLNGRLPPARYGICFVADKDYFRYPNDSAASCRLNPDQFKEVLIRNAWLMGKLTAMGVLHLAPIPLFHNRVQVNRRRDRGLYEWYRGGRLDRWLDSCSYPNLGVTGVRDFEHLITFKGSNQTLYRHMGNHFLSLLLIAGSYFRNKVPELVGFTERGKPVDARFLFDQKFLEEIIGGIFQNYYEGFIGSQFAGHLPVDSAKLSERMIEEMGVDRYMTEYLRVADQDEMSDGEFKAFLSSRGQSREANKGVAKGLKDILVHSGPHLGGFNQQISLPELIESVATMSALCLFCKFDKTRHSHPDAAVKTSHR